ncbi:MAG: bifunctional methylenetetrahydrofolate dehydrogenase/methenyltetrahydrofolate cyclohydrolase FolD [Clostridia bacterium]|nr:bifunctional methylenetetrahydrofolate dehydrogenase/methenyltetrahydrofolate cyclohydrolase FolD [Clostridia bacterium]
MSEIIDGKALAAEIKQNLQKKAEEFENRYGRKITLAVILVGENPASCVYVNNKVKAAEFVGIKSLSFNLPENALETDVIKVVEYLSEDKSVDGILVQLPLPKHINEEKILSLIPPEKDVDGFTAENVGNTTLFKDCINSCTPAGIIYMLKSIDVPLCGKHAVIIGRSNIVGKPVALLLLKENCTITVCHSKTENLSGITKQADILIAAIGKPKFVKADMVKEGAVVIDVGFNRTDNGLCGDVDFEGVNDRAAYISPVPGGVGPMTIAMLMQNAYKCAVRRENAGL